MASSSQHQDPVQDEIPEELMEFLEPANKDIEMLAKRTLVGQLCSTKTQNKPAAKSIIYKAWSAYPNLQITDCGRNRFLFTFEREEHCKEVLKRAPWFFMNCLMCLQYWIPSITPEELNFDFNPFWIQIHNLPMELLNGVNGTTILEKIGRVLEVEESILEGRVLRTFLRARVLIDITKPFPTGCWIPRRNLPKIWVSYKFERLQHLCFICGCLGHEQKYCKATRVMSSLDLKIPKYHQSMAALPSKSIAAVLNEHKRRYGDSTKDTAHKFTRSKEPEQNDLAEGEEDAATREKNRVAWAKMLANCSYGTGTVPDTFGSKPKELWIRDVTQVETYREWDCVMPLETHLSDAELAVYRRVQTHMNEDELEEYKAYLWSEVERRNRAALRNPQMIHTGVRLAPTGADLFWQQRMPETRVSDLLGIQGQGPPPLMFMKRLGIT